MSLKFVPKGPINNIPALVQIMTWRRPGDKPLSEPMMVGLLTHICVTRPQWVKATRTDLHPLWLKTLLMHPSEDYIWYLWLGMRLWYLQGINNGDTTVLYWTIDIWPRRSTFIGLQRSEQRKTSTATRVSFRKTYMKSFSYRFSYIQCINIQEYQTRLIAFFKLWRLVFISIWAITEKNIIPISWEINCINFSHKSLAQGERWNEHSCHILTPTLSQSNVHFFYYFSATRRCKEFKSSPSWEAMIWQYPT